MLNLSSPQTVWRLALLISAILLVGILGYSLLSIVRALRGTDRPATAISLPATQEQATAPAVPSSQDTPAIEAATPVHASAAQVQAPQEASEFTVDYQTLREREVGRKEMIESLRQQAKENTESDSALSEERIRKLEQSGDSLQ